MTFKSERENNESRSEDTKIKTDFMISHSAQVSSGVQVSSGLKEVVVFPSTPTRNMSLVDLGKRLLDAAKRGETEELGTSPLHFSAQYGHIETAEVLLRAGISRDARTKVDRTPLHVAAQEGHVDIVELLFDRTPLDIAIEIAGITEGESITIETTEATEEVQEVETETETETIETVVTTTDSMLTDSLTKKILPVQLIQNISTSKGEESESRSEDTKIKKIIELIKL
ncbi:hypothetical protein KUTeg_015748 [Tegillarca granosa]|uniref:Uncharacterized protein n=1 Tax=Tegillarca granosa TaxID=220873 RepID=A0ABQ9ERZ3_TEGGR|nr:hypothetical protein KUTeg_015748 [Tegillarca granosa]